MNLKEFEEKHRKIINVSSSFLLSFSIHAAIITTGFIIYKNINIPEPIPKEQRIKINLKEEIKKIEKKEKAKKHNRKKETKKEDKIEKKIENKINKELIKKYPNKGIELSYGEKFFELSEEEQRYLIKNWDINNQINEIVSLSVVKKFGIEGLDKNDSNTISFYLYPDGNISDIKFKKEREGSKFDAIIKETIIHSVKGYDKPKEKTLINIFISIGNEDF